VLTGAGGGTWIVPLGLLPDDTRQTPVTVVAEAAPFCRTAGKLLTVEELAPDVEGDPELADLVFTAVQLFAV
jgi:hypothetical protein